MGFLSVAVCKRVVPFRIFYFLGNLIKNLKFILTFLLKCSIIKLDLDIFYKEKKHVFMYHKKY